MSSLSIHRPHMRRSDVIAAFLVSEDQNREFGRPFVLRGPSGAEVDSYRSAMAADCYCAALNRGRAEIHPHAVVGCRVQVLGH